MFNWIKRLFKKPAVEVAIKTERSGKGLFSTHGNISAKNFMRFEREFAAPKVSPNFVSAGMDDWGDNSDGTTLAKPNFGVGLDAFPVAVMEWFSQQFFLGYQVCAILAQHWLIYKACNMPAKDAIRKGWDITINDGTELDPKHLQYIRTIDKRMKIKWHLEDFVTKGKIFGIRIAMFKMNIPAETEEEFYFRPFNLDGVTPGMYKGIVQIDPYWCSPELGNENVKEPTNEHFYEPEYWRIGSLTVHRSHLVIYRTGTVADILKPAYFYGGVSIPQQIYERVYAAERTANEAPMLAMTKRLTVLSTDLEQVVANPDKFAQRMEWWRSLRDNFGVKVNGTDDKLEQFDLTLTDLDNVIMTQYQIVAAIARVPGTKLLGTQPKGFNSTGEFEESSYHEELENVQDDNTKLLDRHYVLVSKSNLLGKFGISPVLEVNWAELDAMTAAEQAEVNGEKAATGAALIASGAIDPEEERERIIADKDSGYNGLQPRPLAIVSDEPTGQEPGQGGTQPGQQPPEPAGSRAAAAGVAVKLTKPKQVAPKGA